MLILTQRKIPFSERAQILMQRLSQHPYLLGIRQRWDLEQDSVIVDSPENQSFSFRVSSDSNLGCWFVTYSEKKQRVLVHRCREHSPLASAYYYLGSAEEDEKIIAFIFDECQRVFLFALTGELPLDWLNQKVLTWFPECREGERERWKRCREPGLS